MCIIVVLFKALKLLPDDVDDEDSSDDEDEAAPLQAQKSGKFSFLSTRKLKLASKGKKAKHFKDANPVPIDRHYPNGPVEMAAAKSQILRGIASRMELWPDDADPLVAQKYDLFRAKGSETTRAVEDVHLQLGSSVSFKHGGDSDDEK